MFKKIIASIMAVAMLAAMSTSVFANETNAEKLYGGGELKEYKTIQQKKAEYMARTDKTELEKLIAAERFDRLEALQKGEISLSMSRATSKTLTMTFYSQKNGYYCGPATLRQTYKFFNTGTPPTQDEIAEAVGTTEAGTELSKMKEYLNNNTTHAYEDLWWYANETAFGNTIIDTIDSNIPIVAHVVVPSNKAGRTSTSDTSKWPRATEGHYLNINGYAGSGSTFAVVDPYADRTIGYSSGKYSVSKSLLYGTKSYLIV